MQIASGATTAGILIALGVLGLLGAALGSAVAFAAVAAWAPGGLAATLAHVPWADVLLILAGLPAMAAVVGWLSAGRQPPASRGSHWSKRGPRTAGPVQMRPAESTRDT